jgi:anti-sigma28 factor (negative regulator of flagellin synthesis)
MHFLGGDYLNYHFASLDDKGEAATSLDLSQTALTAAEWLALMTALTNFSNTDAIQTVKLKLVEDNYSDAPAFTAAALSNATSVIIDVSGVKNAGSQVSVTELPTASDSLQVEQRVTSASSVDRSSTASWKGYFEYLLANISGSSYTLDLTASDVQIETTAQLTALSTALSGLSSANKLKIQNIKLKIATGDRSTDFELSTDLAGFTNLTSVIVDATGALKGTEQSLTTFNFTNDPISLAQAETHVTSLAAVDTDTIASWNYYLAYREYTDGGLVNLDLSGVSLPSQDDVTAFLHALNNQAPGYKSTLESLKLKLASTFATNVNLTAGSITGLDHASFAVEVDRNGANDTAPIGFTFGINAGEITADKTTIKDSVFTSFGLFDGTNAHHWLGYVRTLLGTLSTGTMTLDLTTHSALEMNSAKLAQFITAMNALPASDKAKVETLKIKIASGDFGSATADLSTITGFSGLTNVIIDRNGARASENLSDKAIGVTPGSATLTINDPELRTVNNKDHTNEWLSYFTYLLNGMTGTTNTLDLSAISITADANVDYGL